MTAFRVIHVIALAYAFFAAGVVIALARNGRRTFDTQFTPQDRRLAGATAFYLAAPVALALHELGHAVMGWILGGHISKVHSFFSGGFIVPVRQPAFAPLEDACIAFAGNVVSLAIGFGAIFWTIRKPINAAWNYARLELARVILWLTLVIYPLGSLLLRSGDFWRVRQNLNLVHAHWGDIAMALYGLGAFFVWRTWRNPWQHRFAWLATPLFDRANDAQKQIDQDPNSTEALLELGRVYLAGNEPQKALPPLERAATFKPDDPEALFLRGLAHLRNANPWSASQDLRAAGMILEAEGPLPARVDLFFEITLALAAARLAVNDPEGALLTAEAAQSQKPSDPRSLLLRTDALVAAGRHSEARSLLQRALSTAEGVLAQEIQRRLQTLPS